MKPNFRTAEKSDLTALVDMLSDDSLGVLREDVSRPLCANYTAAFEAISQDKNNMLIVAELDRTLVGMLQSTYIPYLTHTGSWRCIIEGVRVSGDHRGQGLGRALLEYAIIQARDYGISIVQLTTDKARPDAIRLYESLGFVATHQGMKLHL